MKQQWLLLLPRLLLLLLLITSITVEVVADWGDLASYEECPVYTTCPVICVTDLDLCPFRCEDKGQVQCADGHCRDVCSNSNKEQRTTTTSCPNSCAPLPCPKDEDEIDNCLAKYDTYYQAQQTCQANDDAEKGNNKIIREEVLVGFVVAWTSMVTIAMLGYCAKHKHRLREGMNMMGYCEDFIGTCLYYGVVATIWMFQLLLAITVILYYVDQVQYEKQNETQLLVAFEVMWMLGFAWTLMVKWPANLRSLFWCPCELNQATHVVVWTQNELDHGMVQSSPHVRFLRRVVSNLRDGLHTVMSTVYSQDASLKNGRWTFCEVKNHDDDDSGNAYFIHNFRRFILVENEFVPGEWKQNNNTFQDLEDSRSGLSQHDVTARLRVVGSNTIDMKTPSFARVLLHEFTQPYYTYQSFIMWSWMPLYYYYMAIVQSSVIIIGGFTVCCFRYRNEKSLYRLTHMDGSCANVLRDSVLVQIPQSELVPGDAIAVEPGLTYCDMVLVSSQGGVLVDESALTGESNPVAKIAIDPSEGNVVVYGSKPGHKRHTIQAGCTVLESESGKNLAIVTKTGSFTNKGELLRDIFSFQRHQFKFDVEVPIVLMLLLFYAIFVFAMVVYMLSYAIEFGWFYGLYGVAACLPPLLPTVFTVSVGVSDNRLSKRNVTCTNSEDILIAGKVNRAFFDKTGTLTKQGLEFISVRSAASWDAGDTATWTSDIISAAMATCHSLSKSETGNLIGNPVDRTLFQSSGASFERVDGASVNIVDSNGHRHQIMKHFDFDHHRMTQCVVVRMADGRTIAFVKGSGESVAKLCDPNSLPSDFTSVLRSSAKVGIYQISMAMKALSSDVINNLAQLSRDDVEKDLTFLGVVNFKNLLREETPRVIRELEEGEVRCVMVTGDSILTGVCIARESGIISPGRKVYIATELGSDGSVVWFGDDDEHVSLPNSLDADLAISGDVWRTLLRENPKLANDLGEQIRVFGRCNPADKVSVLTHSIDNGNIALMTGDGGNDCGALKTAHVGVALSDTEASIVAPFSSLDKSITSVVDVLREGRCSLASALASYKFMILYGQLTVGLQFALAYFRITLTEWMWVWIDGIFAISLGFTLPLAKPAAKLAPSTPTSSLLGPLTLSSAGGILLINYLFIVIAIAFLFGRDWFSCRQWSGEDISNVVVIGDNYETSTLFVIVGNQFVTIALTWNIGYEHREAWYKNRWLVGLCAILLLIHYWITLAPGRLSCLFRVNCDNEHVVRSISTWSLFPIQNEWNTTEMPIGYRFALVILMLLNTAAVVSWDYFAVNRTRKRLGAKKRQEAAKFSVPPESAVDYSRIV